MSKTKPMTKSPDEMTEAELAEYFYAHRDDLAGDEVPSRVPVRMDVMISARFSKAEAGQVRRAAARAGMSVSAFLRQCALSAVDSDVVDLERVRADLRELHAKATALLVLTYEPTLHAHEPTPHSSQPPPPAKPAKPAKRRRATV